MDTVSTIATLQPPPPPQACKRGVGNGSGSRITRSSLACLPCRTRHVKCDGGRPRCGRCVEIEKECDYAQSRRGGLDRAALAERRKRLAAAEAQTSSQGGSVSAQGPSRDPGLPFSIPESLCDSSWDTTTLGSINIDNRTPFSVSPSPSVTCDAVGSDKLVELYYSNFHSLHPFTPPRKRLVALCQDDSRWPTWKPLVATLRLVGHLYGSHEWSTTLENEVMSCLSQASQRSPVIVQARLLFSMVLFWHGLMSAAKREMDLAVQGALDVGMFRREFASDHGQGDLVLQESWRRTWWMLYITDAYYAGTLGTPELAISDVQATVDLPCEESEYESGNIPLPKTQHDFDCREFATENMSFSSFAYLVGAVRCASMALSQTLGGTKGECSTQVVQTADSAMDGWRLLLPADKKQLMNKAGEIDELMFQAHLIIHVTTVSIHRPLSDLKFNEIEDISSCAREPACGKPKPELINVHTVRVLRAVEAQIRLLTLPSRTFRHTPFTTCMVSEGTLALLSACNYLLKGKELAVARDQIRMTIGCLRSLGEIWPRTARNVKEIQTIARHVLGLGSRSASDSTPGTDQLPDLTGSNELPSFEVSTADTSSNVHSSEPSMPDSTAQWFSLDDLQADFAWWPDSTDWAHVT